MKENICKQNDWQGINFQNIQTAYAGLSQNKIIKMWAEDLNRYFTEEDIQMVRQHMKRCLTTLVLRENANLKHNEVSPDTVINGHRHKVYEQ